MEDIIERLRKAYELNDYEEQVKEFINLGNYYIDVKKDYINAIAILNFALGICEDTQKNTLFLANSHAQYQPTIVTLLKEAERHFLVSINSLCQIPSDRAQDHAHKFLLQSIRAQARDKLHQQQELRDQLSSQQEIAQATALQKARNIQQMLEVAQLSTQQIYKTINEQMRALVKLLIDECKQALGEPPCTYAIVCLGSLARDEATPYSDLEFAIIIHDAIDTFEQWDTLSCSTENKLLSYREVSQYSNEKNKHYFRNLTNLLNIKIINLGETTPRAQHIVSLDHLGLLERSADNPVRKGFAYDSRMQGACKTPLGNKHLTLAAEKTYELINTVSEMIRLYESNHYESIEHMTAILDVITLIEGDVKLVEKYEKAIAAINTARAETEGQSEKTEPANVGQIKALELLEKDILKFKPAYKNRDNAGKIYNAKYDLYRLFTTFVKDLGLYFNTQTKSAWLTLDKLYEKKILSEKGINNLKIVISIIERLRLATYLHHNQQSDYVQLRNINHSLEHFDHIFYTNNPEEFIRIHQTLLPFYEAVKYFYLRAARKGGSHFIDLIEVLAKEIDGDIKPIQFSENDFFDDNLLLKAEIYEFLFNYPEALKCLHAAQKLNTNKLGAKIKLSIQLGDLYDTMEEYTTARSSYNTALSLLDRHIDPSSLADIKLLTLTRITLLGKIACADMQLCDHNPSLLNRQEKEIKNLETALDIQVDSKSEEKEIADERKLDLIDIHQGFVKSHQAFMQHLVNENIETDLYEFDDYYFQTELLVEVHEIVEKIQCMEKIRRSYEQRVGLQTAKMANMLEKLGKLYKRIGKYPLAIDCLEKAADIISTIFKSIQSNSQEILDGLGDCYMALNNPTMAHAEYLLAYTLKRKLHDKIHQDKGNTIHLDKNCLSIADSCLKLAATCMASNIIGDTLEFLKEAAYLYINICGETHYETARFYQIVALYSRHLDVPEAAYILYTRAYEIFKSSFGLNDPQTKATQSILDRYQKTLPETIISKIMPVKAYDINRIVKSVFDKAESYLEKGRNEGIIQQTIPQPGTHDITPSHTQITEEAKAVQHNEIKSWQKESIKTLSSIRKESTNLIEKERKRLKGRRTRVEKKTPSSTISQAAQSAFLFFPPELESKEQLYEKKQINYYSYENKDKENKAEEKTNTRQLEISNSLELFNHKENDSAELDTPVSFSSEENSPGNATLSSLVGSRTGNPLYSHSSSPPLETMKDFTSQALTQSNERVRIKREIRKHMAVIKELIESRNMGETIVPSFLEEVVKPQLQFSEEMLAGEYEVDQWQERLVSLKACEGMLKDCQKAPSSIAMRKL